MLMLWKIFNAVCVVVYLWVFYECVGTLLYCDQLLWQMVIELLCIPIYLRWTCQALYEVFRKPTSST